MHKSTNPYNREFNLGRDHGVGQFLNAHPEAKAVMSRLRKEAAAHGLLSPSEVARFRMPNARGLIAGKFA